MTIVPIGTDGHRSDLCGEVPATRVEPRCALISA